METKLCRKCNLIKDVDRFRLKKDKCGKYYRYSYCKQCENENRKIYDINYREKNKEKINAKRKNREISLEEKAKRKKYMEAYIPVWRSKNKDKIKQYYTKDNKKRNENKFLHLKDQIRHEIRRCFISKGKTKSKYTEEIIGCPINFLVYHLQQTYKTNYGIEWDGIEKVHIDHKTPLATAKTEEDIIKLCHYSNLQLLKAKDNLQKYNKTNWEL